MRKRQNRLGWSKNQFLLNPTANGIKSLVITVLLLSDASKLQNLGNKHHIIAVDFCMGTEILFRQIQPTFVSLSTLDRLSIFSDCYSGHLK